jgi:dTDP-4-amino-4,6-dideoxygalactose transaminase
MRNRIWLSSPHMGNEELKYVTQAFESNWIAPLGPNVDKFEDAIVNYTKAKYATALSSGTAAIHLALIILGVQAGDEVICQSFTFSASANPILYLGATPIFVDSEPESWNMSPYHLRKAIEDRLKRNKKPKAIIPVHLYGMPANFKEIASIASEYNIPVIEDAAEALGSFYYDKSCGSLSEMGILSFNGNKIITTSGGGALISDNESHIKKAKFLATQARDPAPHYQHSEIGYNYRMSNVCAGIGRGQMEVLDERVKARRKNFDRYVNAFNSISGISFQCEEENSMSNRWLTCIILEPSEVKKSSDKLRIHLETLNIETRPLWKPMHLQPVFKDYPYYGEGVAESLFKKGLCLPSGSNLKDDEIELVIETIIKYLS